MNIEELTLEMEKTLDDQDVEWDYEGIEKNISEYKRNKTPLVEVLRKSPHWNEDLHGLLFDSKEVRTLDTYITSNLFGQLVNMLSDEEDFKLCRSVCYYDIYGETFVNERLAKDINKTYPDMRVKEGQKVSRMVNKLWKMLGVDTNSKEYQEVFAKFADAVNPISITRPFILSANPSDYLTMSYGSSWASCHILNPDKSRGGSGYSGCYKSGTLSYMNDPHTLIGYTLEKLPENLRDACRTPKITRQCFMVDVEQGLIMQSRQYPETHNKERADEYRKLVQQGVAEALGQPNLWTNKKESNHPFSKNVSMHYADYHYTNDYDINVSWLKAFNDRHESVETAWIGERVYCLKCGYEVDDTEYVLCEACEHTGKKWCECCEEWCDEYDGAETRNGWRCDDCLNEFYAQCEECGEWVNIEDSHSIAGTDMYICDDCFRYSDRYVHCSNCGDLIDTYEETMVEVADTGEMICEYCADNIYERCTECGRVFYELNNEGICEDCENAMREEAA